MLSLALFILYSIWIQHNRGGLWNVCLLLTPFALVVDVLANYTELSIYFGTPRTNEYTFSSKLERLIKEDTNVGQVARRVAKFINGIDPLHKHIKGLNDKGLGND